ncbi:MAG: twin-arginine translocation signal domain-containing protein, partial [Verrucomicrobiota bacterium]|nr:twin-arginine translocation signal domain-containing protein [Verrucomicrobiota bacterium]
MTQATRRSFLKTVGIAGTGLLAGEAPAQQSPAASVPAEKQLLRFTEDGTFKIAQ